MAPPATRIWDVCNDLLAGVVSYHGGSLPGRQYVSAGSPAWDCELLAVWCETTNGNDGSPELDAISAHSVGAAHVMRSGVFVVSLVRCTPAVPDGVGDVFVPPSVDKEHEAAFEVYSDAQRTLNALREAEKAGELASCHGLIFSGWTVRDPEGGFVGGELRVIVSLGLAG